MDLDWSWLLAERVAQWPVMPGGRMAKVGDGHSSVVWTFLLFAPATLPFLFVPLPSSGCNLVQLSGHSPGMLISNSSSAGHVAIHGPCTSFASSLNANQLASRLYTLMPPSCAGGGAQGMKPAGMSDHLTMAFVGICIKRVFGGIEECARIPSPRPGKRCGLINGLM